MRSLLRACTGLAAALAFAHACSHGLDLAPSPDGGTAGTPDGGLVDAGPGGSPDAGCASDQACGAARWCEKSTGACRDAKPCPQGQRNCDYQGSAPDYCDGHACFCDPVDSACRPLHGPCAPCARTAECGSDRLAYDYPADCVAPDAGFSDASACIPRRDGYFGCPPGYFTPASGAYCLPAGGRCGAQGACTTDSACDPHSEHPVCNAAIGACASACTFDLKTGESLCPSGQVCHLTTALSKLAPQEANYGKGKCGPPCTAQTACGPGLVCRSEGVDHPVQRCGLPPPQCLGDVECPDSPSTNSHGYCDRAAHECRTGCRTVADCRAGFLCSSGDCVAQTCLQAGGAQGACDYGQFCCGQSGSPLCPSGVDAGACYDRPAQTWCASCGKDADCRTSALPARPGEPNLCVKVNGNNVCALGCTPGDSAACPRSWGCVTVFVSCKQGSDCGSQAGARCSLPADGGSGECACASDSDCPADGHACRQGKCVITDVCRPNCP